MAIPTLSPAAMRLVKLLVGNPPQTVAKLIDAAGVTRTAVTEQLSELLHAGFVERTTQRLPGRGRPRHLYSATDAALLLLFVGNQRLVVPAICRAIEQIGGKRLKKQVIERASESLAAHYRRRIKGKTTSERFRQMAKLLREDEGNLVELRRGKNGHLTMHRRSCGFFSMFEESRTVCQLDMRVMSRVIGASIRQTACRHDGDPCCVFEVADSKR